MRCPWCGRSAMDLGLLAGPEPRELLFLCEGCGYVCTLHGLPWAAAFTAPDAGTAAALQYDDLGELECGRCGGPVRAAEFERGDGRLLCGWCGRIQPAPKRGRAGGGVHAVLQSWASLGLAPLMLCQSVLTDLAECRGEPRGAAEDAGRGTLM